jgi:hypothetical protein
VGFLCLPKIKDMLRAITTTIIGVILGMMGMI